MESVATTKLAVTIKEARAMLGIGNSKIYDLINADELTVFKVGVGTRVTVASIEAFIDRQVEARKAAA